MNTLEFVFNFFLFILLLKIYSMSCALSEENQINRLKLLNNYIDPPHEMRMPKTKKTKKSTTKNIHFFLTTKTQGLDLFRNCPISIDNGSGSFYEQRISELVTNQKECFDKSYILKEIGDKIAPCGRKRSKALYFTGYRFLEDNRIIDMICKFFDIEVDSMGNELPDHLKINKKLFSGGKVLLKGSEHQMKPLFVSDTYLWKYQGQIPTVVLNFHHFNGTSYEEIRSQIALEIRKLFSKYSHLFNSNVLSKRAQNCYEIYSSGDVTHDELYNAIVFLMKTLYNNYRRQLLFILNDGPNTVIVNYKNSVGYSLSDNFGNLKLQILHKYANIVRKNCNLMDSNLENQKPDQPEHRLDQLNNHLRDDFESATQSCKITTLRTLKNKKILNKVIRPKYNKYEVIGKHREAYRRQNHEHKSQEYTREMYS